MKKGLVTLNVFLLCCIVALAASTICRADNFSRTNKMEIFGFDQYLFGDTVNLSNFPGGTLELKNSFGGGLGFGYNINDFLNINADFLYLPQNINLNDYFDYGLQDTTVLGTNVNLDYNILKNRLTPLITGGLGLLNFSGNDIGLSETDFSYNLGLGLRWDVANNLFLKGVYNFTWTNLNNSDSTVLFNGPALFIGYKFQ